MLGFVDDLLVRVLDLYVFMVIALSCMVVILILAHLFMVSSWEKEVRYSLFVLLLLLALCYAKVSS